MIITDCYLKGFGDLALARDAVLTQYHTKISIEEKNSFQPALAKAKGDGDKEIGMRDEAIGMRSQIKQRLAEQKKGNLDEDPKSETQTTQKLQ